MASKVFVHVGAPLVSTSVSAALAANRRRLTRLGVLYPPGHLGHDGGHLDAVLDVLELSHGDAPTPVGAWDRLAETVRDWRRGTAVVSHALLADADAEQVRRVVSSFGDAEVHVVYVARGLAQQVPEAWLQWVRHGGTTSFSTYAARVLGRDGHRLSRVYWRSHDLGGVLGRWAAHVPADRVHLVTVPPDDEALAWARFATVVGVDPSLVPAPPLAAPTGSLLAGEVVRLANAASHGRHDPEALASLVARAGVVGGAVPRLPDSARSTVTGLVAAAEAVVRTLGVDVVGDLADLAPGEGTFATDPGEVEPDEQAVIAAQTRLLLALSPGTRRPGAPRRRGSTDAEGPAGVGRRAPRVLARVLRRRGGGGPPAPGPATR